MDEFDRAQIRAAKRQAHMIKHQSLAADNPLFHKDHADGFPTLHLPKIRPPKTPMKRTNEIEITVYVDGEVINMTAFTNLNDIIASQRTREGLLSLMRETLSAKFGKVRIE